MPDDTVVEAGCGWGALALHMVMQYDVRVNVLIDSRCLHNGQNAVPAS